VFRLLPVNPGPDLATEAAIALAGGGERAARRILESLARAHLIQHDAERWRMHDLVRVYASELADPGDAPAHEEALDRLLGHYLKIVGDADTTMRALPGDSRFRNATEALAWLDLEQANLVAAVTSAAQRPTGGITRPFLVSILAGGLDAYLRRRRRFDDAVAVAQAALAIVGQKPGFREEQILDQLGLAQWEMGRADEAISTYDRAAEIRQQRPPPYMESVANASRGFRMYKEAQAISNRGLALRSMGRPVEAADAFVRAVDLFERSGHQLQAGLALGNLGLAMMDVGYYEGAVDALEQDVAICRECGDRHSEGAALNSLGTALMFNRQFGDAIAAHQEPPASSANAMTLTTKAPR
jgi:tetratricopeptide (TPR) repeat protein